MTPELVTHEVRPFRIGVPDADLADLRDRLARTRWPGPATEPGWEQGPPQAYLQELVEHRRDGDDWRATVDRLNALHHLLMTVDGLDLHLVHARSTRPDATPVVLTHGWPGSFLEFEAVVPMLIDPPPGEPAFHVVLPSLPGYGFSGHPTEPGWDVHRIADAWVELMTRLGYDRFVAGGSDWGTSVSTCIGLQHPDRVHGLFLVPPLVTPARRAEPTARGDGSAYSHLHVTRPQTIGYALADSPVGLLAWVVEKVWSWSDHDGDLDRVVGRDRLLDDVSLYWLTRSAGSSARLYRESFPEVSPWFEADAGDGPTFTVDVPTGCVVFPAEIPHPTRSEAERRFRRIVHWAEPERGGHFGAWEQPDLFVRELRSTARALGPVP